MPKSQSDRSKRGSVKAPTEKSRIQLGRLVTLVDKQNALNMLARVAASGKQYHQGISDAIRAISVSASVQVRAVQLELAGANLEGERDVHVTFNDLEPALREAMAEIERLKVRVEAYEKAQGIEPPSGGAPPGSNGRTLN